MMPQYVPGLLITRVYTVWLPSVVSNEFRWTWKNESASCLSLQSILIFIGVAFAVSLGQIYAAGCRGGRSTSVLGIAMFPSNVKEILCKTKTSLFVFFSPSAVLKHFMTWFLFQRRLLLHRRWKPILHYDLLGRKQKNVQWRFTYVHGDQWCVSSM